MKRLNKREAFLEAFKINKYILAYVFSSINNGDTAKDFPKSFMDYDTWEELIESELGVGTPVLDYIPVYKALFSLFIPNEVIIKSFEDVHNLNISRYSILDAFKAEEDDKYIILSNEKFLN